MNRRIGDLLAQRAREAFIGRSAELEVLLSMLDGGPQVVFVHGIAGTGKFTLLEAFAEQARSRGATVVRLDCRGVEPTDHIWAEASAGAGRVGDTGDVTSRFLLTSSGSLILEPSFGWPARVAFLNPLFSTPRSIFHLSASLDMLPKGV